MTTTAEAPVVQDVAGHEAARRLRLIEELAADIASTRAKFKRATTDVAKLTAERKLAMEKVRELDKAIDASHEEMEALIAGKGPERLQFSAVAANGGGEPAQNIPENIPAAADPDAWRDFGAPVLTQYGLKQAVVDRLVDAGLRTLGAVEDWRAADCQTPKVKGFAGAGTATRKALDDAFEGYWASHPPAPGMSASEAVSRHGEPAPPAGMAAPGDADAPEGPEAAPEPARPPDGVYGPADVGLTPGEVAARAHMHLLTPLQVGKVPVLRSIVEHGGERYVVTPAPAGDGEDVYALRLLLHPDDIPLGYGAYPDGWEPPRPDDPYFGGSVTWQGDPLRIGPFGFAILVRDPGSGQG